MSFDLYNDIAERTNGEIYLGVVGPVRTGKSTFIKRFMEQLVIPNIEDNNVRERTRDEMPQSGTGSQITTTEPKFIPRDAVSLFTEDEYNDDSKNAKIRLIDCVGYMIDGASGVMDGEEMRLVETPWSDEKMPLSEAGELGTKKVIREHSTIAVVVTTDGTVTNFPRTAYIDAENKAIEELKELDKPFVVIVNSKQPESLETEEIRKQIELTHNATVLAYDIDQIKPDDIRKIMEAMLSEFPIQKIELNFPRWVETLEQDHWLKAGILESINTFSASITKLSDINNNLSYLTANDLVKKAYVEKIDFGKGDASIDLNVRDNLLFTILSEMSQMDIKSEYELINKIKLLATAKIEYDKFKDAVTQVSQNGYGVVMPRIDEMSLSKPELVKHGSKYGVKIKAVAPSVHLIKADIETEISPIVGSEQQSQELIEYLSNEMDKDNGEIWDLNIFGKNMETLVAEGINNKLYSMPQATEVKLQESLQKIINENARVWFIYL